MVKLEIYVVTTNLKQNPKTFHVEGLREAREALEQLKVELCKQFGGLTESATAQGYWLDNGKLVRDDVIVWTIYSTTVITPSTIFKYAESLRKICSQEVQLFVINDKPYFINNDPCLRCTKNISCELCEHTEGED